MLFRFYLYRLTQCIQPCKFVNEAYIQEKPPHLELHILQQNVNIILVMR